jgi:hypothetical protein
MAAPKGGEGRGRGGGGLLTLRLLRLTLLGLRLQMLCCYRGQEAEEGGRWREAKEEGEGAMQKLL